MIENFKIEDLDRVMEIWLETNLLAHDFVDREYFLSNFLDVKESISQAEVYVYRENEMIIGFIGLVDGYIAGLFVDKDFQKKGIGSKLLAFAKGRYKYLSLDVFKDNEKAVLFYKKQDFKIEVEKIDDVNKLIEYEMIWEE